MTAPALRGPLCPHCHLPAPPGLRAHLECVLEATRLQVAERATRERTAEAREERAKLDAAAGVARRTERARIVSALQELRDEYRLAAMRTELADMFEAAVQRAAGLDEALKRIGDDGGGE